AELKSAVVTEQGEPVLHQHGTVLDPIGVAGRWTKFVVKTDKPALVLLGVKYDKWWRVYVNGHTVPLIRANSIFAAAQVPAGTSEVLVQLRPWSAWAGIAISIVTVMALLAAYIFTYRRGDPAQIRRDETRSDLV
ncbi:MAG: hypothetical protein KGQ82_10360, partial [Alphaproteobacteria bacterium]|nr:hypothetical protein [Alphaproteobacteria bacterium]